MSKVVAVPPAVRLRRKYPSAIWPAGDFSFYNFAPSLEDEHPSPIPGSVMEYAWGLEAVFTVPNLVTFKHRIVYAGKSVRCDPHLTHARILVIDRGSPQITVGPEVSIAQPGHVMLIPALAATSITAEPKLDAEIYEVFPRT